MNVAIIWVDWIICWSWVGSFW